MAAYADPDVVQDRSGVTFDDLGLADQAALDALILALNQRASAIVEQIAGRDFEHHQNDAISVDGSGTNDLVLPGYPILSVASVSVNDTALDAADYRIKPGTAAYAGQGNAGVLERRNFVWNRGWENVEVTYTWGYVTPPDIVAEATERLVVRALLSAQRSIDSDAIQSYSMDGFSVTFDQTDPMKDVEGIRELLAPITEVAVA